jgi:segregation and condensation protein A
LDLLLYLIRQQNLDILDIPMVKITNQYMAYIEMMQAFQLLLAADYLLMAATLAEIKSRMLLPKPVLDQTEALDPRAELVRRLQVYEQFKLAADEIDHLPRAGRDTCAVHAIHIDAKREKPLPMPDLAALAKAFQAVLSRTSLQAKHAISADHLSIRSRMSDIMLLLQGQDQLPFEQLFNVSEGRLGVVVSFVALLELTKENLIEVIQSGPNAPIYVALGDQDIEGVSYAK